MGSLGAWGLYFQFRKPRKPEQNKSVGGACGKDCKWAGFIAAASGGGKPGPAGTLDRRRHCAGLDLCSAHSLLGPGSLTKEQVSRRVNNRPLGL